MSLAAAAPSSEPATVELVFSTTNGPATVSVPIRLPELPAPEPIIQVVEVEVPKIVEVQKIVEVPVAAPAPAGATSPPPARPAPPARTEPVWYLVIGIGALVVIMLLVLIARTGKRGAAPGGAGVTAPPRPLPPPGRVIAYLESGGPGGERHAIASAAFRIGRQADNDLVLQDTSISRHHAEIHRRRDGTFTVTDLDSMNGVFVNGKKQRSAAIADGDTVELGDLSMRFSINEEEAAAGEETVILRTVVPDRPLEDDQQEKSA